MSDLISRQAAIDAVHSYFKDKLDGLPTEETEEGYEVFCDMDKIDAFLSDNKYLSKRIKNLPSAQPEPIKLHVDHALTEEEIKNLKQMIANSPTVLIPSAQPEIIHCCDCIYYDPEHIEKNGVRYEYEDMPKDAFDILGTGLVNSEYGINVGGRCCRDYNVGYSEDKRVFVSKQNYCGRAERRTDE